MTIEATIQNIGGIRSGRATIESGLNVVKGANWQGKTSFVQSVESAIGIPRPVTEGTDSGVIELAGDGIHANVEVLERNDRLVVEGTPLLESEPDRTKANLFACLGESNPIRETVRAGENLESVLTRPLDLENIDQRISELKHQRDRIDTEISKAQNSKNAIPRVKERIETLETKIEEHVSRLETLESNGAENGTNKRDQLSQARSERNRLQSDVDRLERSIERYEEKIEEKVSTLESTSVDDIDIEYQDIETKKGELDEVRSDIKVLESLFTANKLILEENSLELIADVEHGLETDTFQCWICGSKTNRGEVEAHIKQLQGALQDHRATANEINNELSEMETKYEQRKQQQKQKNRLETDIQELRHELEEKRQRLADRTASIEQLDDQIEELREEVDESVAEITDVESELKFRRSELEEAEADLEQHQRNAYQIDQLEEQRADLQDELTELRDRKASIKTEMRETFHETMQAVITAFETGFESARLTGNFELVVAREGREANLDALSEGELELLGFVAALAGYETFDVSETVPFLLLDGLEALSDDNLHTLVEYFEDRAEYVIVTAHPEHAAFAGNQIDPKGWETVTNKPAAETA